MRAADEKPDAGRSGAWVAASFRGARGSDEGDTALKAAPRPAGRTRLRPHGEHGNWIGTADLGRVARPRVSWIWFTRFCCTCVVLRTRLQPQLRSGSGPEDCQGTHCHQWELSPVLKFQDHVPPAERNVWSGSGPVTPGNPPITLFL